MTYLVCRETNTSGDEYVRIETETPEKLCDDEPAAREYCVTAERKDALEGSGNTTGFAIYKLDYPRSDVPELVARWFEDEQEFDRPPSS